MSRQNNNFDLYTTHEPCQAQVIEYKGLVIVNKAKSRNVFSDCFTIFSSCFGGEMSQLTKLTAETRQELIEDATYQARSLGANALVGIHFETNTIFDGMLDMVMYGTAVKIAKGMEH